MTFKLSESGLKVTLPTELERVYTTEKRVEVARLVLPGLSTQMNSPPSATVQLAARKHGPRSTSRSLVYHYSCEDNSLKYSVFASALRDPRKMSTSDPPRELTKLRAVTQGRQNK